MKKEKVVIIGAGPAGLTAAYKLLTESNNYEVLILEASDSIGGISKTINYKGNRMDIGGHRFFSKNREVMNLWKEIMPIQGKPSYDDKILKTKKQFMKDGPNPEKEDNCFLIRNRISRIYYSNHFFDYPITINLKTIKNLGLLNTFLAGTSYLKTLFIKKKEDNLENFYINRFGKKLYTMFFEKYTEKLWGIHPSNISADWGAQRVKGLSITKVLEDMLKKILHIKNKKKETSLIEEFYYPKYGPGQLWETLADIIEKKGGKILKNCQVETINFKDDVITDVICNLNNKKEKITGNIFISSMPLSDLVMNLKGNKTISKKILNIAENLPFRDFITVGILVDDLLIKNQTKIKTLKDIIPDCWIYVQEPNIKMCRFQIFNNWSPYLVKQREKNIWIGLEYTCSTDDELWKMNDKQFTKFAINELVAMNIIDKKSVKDTHLERVKKAYPAYFGTYSEINSIIKYINRFTNLYCIGRNGQHRYNNMDHSMITAFETVNNIINNKTDKNVIWNVNTEKEYHEEKKYEKNTSNIKKV